MNADHKICHEYSNIYRNITKREGAIISIVSTLSITNAANFLSLSLSLLLLHSVRALLMLLMAPNVYVLLSASQLSDNIL